MKVCQHNQPLNHLSNPPSRSIMIHLDQADSKWRTHSLWFITHKLSHSNHGCHQLRSELHLMTWTLPKWRMTLLSMTSHKMKLLSFHKARSKYEKCSLQSLAFKLHLPSQIMKKSRNHRSGLKHSQWIFDQSVSRKVSMDLMRKWDLNSTWCLEVKMKTSHFTHFQ